MNDQKPAAPVLGGGGFLRVRLDVSYDGGPFSGWALQPGRRTVQGVLEEALHLLVRRPIRVTVAGRTDAGVHARSAVGVAVLPLDAPVEVELVAEFR